MRCHYINLDASADRRISLEANFDLFRRPGWRLERFAAVSADLPEVAGVPGRATAAEKACYLSHARVIAAACDIDGPAMVLEDDAAFGPSTCGVIERTLAALTGDDWDVLFTSVCIPDFNRWIDLLRLYRNFRTTGDLTYVSLKGVNFAGTSAYIVREGAKDKLAKLLDFDAIDAPIDLRLRTLTNRGLLRAYILCPFATSLSPAAQGSTLRTEGSSADAIWNLFTRLFTLDRDEAACRVELDHLAGTVEADVEPFAALFTAALSGRFIFR